MSTSISEAPIDDVPRDNSDQSLEKALPAGEVGDSGAVTAEPQVTFRGNSYDLISLASLITGGMILFSCLTCGMGYYCLPIISVALGAVGVLSARQAVDAKRTRLWSWLGIAAGGIIFLLMAALFILYIGFVVLAIVAQGRGY